MFRLGHLAKHPPNHNTTVGKYDVIVGDSLPSNSQHASC